MCFFITFKITSNLHRVIPVATWVCARHHIGFPTLKQFYTGILSFIVGFYSPLFIFIIPLIKGFLNLMHIYIRVLHHAYPILCKTIICGNNNKKKQQVVVSSHFRGNLVYNNIPITYKTQGLFSFRCSLVVLGAYHGFYIPYHNR